MRTTVILYRQHVQYHFRKHWMIQGNKRIIETGAEQALTSKGINVIDANEYIQPEKKEKFQIQVIKTIEYPLPRDKNHPEYKERYCRLLTDANVLVKGYKQVQVLLNTVEVSKSLPDSIESKVTELPENIHDQIIKSILASHCFDGQQVKLPRVFDPEPKREFFKFPRTLGICDIRRNEILSNKLLNILEKYSNDSSKKRRATQDPETIASFVKDGDLIQLKYPPGILISSDTPLEPVTDVSSVQNMELPNIFPLKHTVTIPKVHFYEFENLYPLDKSSSLIHPHTIFSHLNETKTANLYDTPVTEDQIEGKTILHAFTTAYAYAKTLYGDVETLQKPVTVQCIHTDSQKFYLGVLQLNSLNIDKDNEVKNIWYSKPVMKLFKKCAYVDGRPTLIGYNPKVFSYLQAMYNQ